MLLKEELSKNIKELEEGVSLLCKKFSTNTGFIVEEMKVTSFSSIPYDGREIDYRFKVKAKIDLNG